MLLTFADQKDRTNIKVTRLIEWTVRSIEGLVSLLSKMHCHCTVSTIRQGLRHGGAGCDTNEQDRTRSGDNGGA